MNNKAYSFVFNDILDRILQLSENPSQFAEYLSHQIRELIGARTIVIAIKDELDQPCIYSVFPERKKEWASSPNMILLADISFTYTKIEYLDNSSNNNIVVSLLQQLEIDKSIVIPLVAANRKVGSILLLDMMDLFGIESVIELLDRLSGVFALIIRNSVLYFNLEKTVALRTEEIQKRNNELLKQEAELKAANDDLKDKIAWIQEINTQLEESKEKAQESDRLKTVFMQNMSHEIRTPMNAIMGFSDLLVKNFDNKEKLQKFTTIIKQRSSDLLELINEILDLSKIETGQLPINVESFYLSELLDELNTFFLIHRQKIGKTHISLTFTDCCKSSDLLISTDKGKLKQIFINLIYNALKFTEEGNVSFGCINEDENTFSFFVSDTGIGIPDDKQTIIFERFMQLNNQTNGALGGTGLGLSIVKGLITLLGGTIRVESKVNQGSTFYFTIPYQIMNQSSTSNKTSYIDYSAKWGDYTLLIVEDDVYNTEYLIEALSDTDINIVAAPDAENAIAIIKSGRPIDIILMDIRMPGMNGLDATKYIKQNKPNIKIIAQTAYASNYDRNQALSIGCNDFISKPVNRDLLLEKINNQLINLK